MTPIDTIKENLSSLALDDMHLSEKRLYELSELSRFLYEEFRGISNTEEAESVFYRRSGEELFLDLLHDEGIPDEYAALLREKAAAVKRSGGAEAERIMQLEKEIEILKSENRKLTA